jgi:hypothetical protein
MIVACCRADRLKGALLGTLDRARRGVWPWLVLGLISSAVIMRQVHLGAQLGAARHELAQERAASATKDQVISELASSLGCANRRVSANSRGPGSKWRSSQVWRYQAV